MLSRNAVSRAVPLWLLASFCAPWSGVAVSPATPGLPVLLATYASEYPTAQIGRSWNIDLAARRLDGAIIHPGETLSFNRTVGPRGLADGFRRAPELLNGDRVEGVGGGVCQVASTLYAAALDAGIAIEARAPHSRASGYVPTGRDATVSFEHDIDLKLRNDLDVAVQVRMRAVGGQLTAELYAERPSGRTVSVEFERARAADGSGLRVVTVRSIAADGAVSREIVSRDVYH